MNVRPGAVAFGLVHTLLSLEPLRADLHDLGLGHRALETWWATTLRDGFALAASGRYATLRQVGEATLGGLLVRAGREEYDDFFARFFDRLAELPASGDAELALRRLRDRRVPAYALTGLDVGTARAALARAGLDRFFERVVSTDEVGQWKPRPEGYLHAARVAGVEPRRLAYVAAHPWDVHGAKCAGLVTGWVRREPGPFPSAFARPDVDGGSLEIVCARLAG